MNAQASAPTVTIKARTKPPVERSIERGSQLNYQPPPADSLGTQWVDVAIDLLQDSVRRLIDTLLDRSEVLAETIDDWLDTLIDAVARSGAGAQAALEGLRAGLTGANPIWAAMKSLVSGLSGKAKTVLVLILAVVLLLGPVLFVVLVLALVVAALVSAVRAASA